MRASTGNGVCSCGQADRQVSRWTAMMTKRGTYKGAYSSVCRNDETHEEITQNTGPNCHSPAQSNRNHRRGYAVRNIRDSRSSCNLGTPNPNDGESKAYRLPSWTQPTHLPSNTPHRRPNSRFASKGESGRNRRWRSSSKVRKNLAPGELQGGS